MEELLAKIKEQWGKPAHCQHCLGEEKLHICSQCASVYCGAQCQSLRDKCALIGVKRAREAPRAEEVVALTDDALLLVMEFLDLEDLKNATLANRQLTRLARREMVRNFFWKYTPEVMQKIHPIHIVVDATWYEAYLKDPLVEEVQSIWLTLEMVHFQHIRLPARVENAYFENVSAANIDLSHNTRLERLEFSETLDAQGFNGPLLLPPSLRYLQVGPSLLDYQLDLPLWLRHLRFEEDTYYSEYDQPLKLPENLKVLHLGQRYNQPLILPMHLEVFKMGDQFNQPINFPHTLTYLVMGNNFSQHVQIPDAVQWLTLGSSFNQPNIVLPSSLTFFTCNNNNGPYIFHQGVEIIRIKRASDFEMIFLPGKSRKQTRITRF